MADDQTSKPERTTWSRLVRPLVVITAAAILFVAMGGRSAFGVWFSATAVGLILSPAAIGVYFSFRVLDFPDLTVEGAFALGGSVSALLMVNGVSPFLALPVAFLASGTAGFATGLIATKLQLHSLLASIIVTTALFSVNLRILGRSNLPLLSEGSFLTPFQESFRSFIAGTFGEDQVRHANNLLAIILAGLFVLTLKFIIDWFMHTEFGSAIRASGDNAQMMRSLGRNTSFYIIAGVILGNGLTGLAGSMSSQFQGFADVNQGLGLIIGGLAAVILGETVFRPQSLAAGTAAVIGGMVMYRIAVAAALTVDFFGFRFAAADVSIVTAVLLLITLGVSRAGKARA